MFVQNIIIALQSPDIFPITGATYSSRGIIEDEDEEDTKDIEDIEDDD